MECSSYRQLVSRYLDDALNEEERNELLLHLGQCSSCRLTLARYRRLEQRLRQAPSTPVPPSCRRGLMDQAANDREPFRARLRLATTGLAVASVTIATLVIATLVMPAILGGFGAEPGGFMPAVARNAPPDSAGASLANGEAPATAALAGYLPPAVSVERVALRWDESAESPEYMEVVFVAPRGTRVRLERTLGRPQRAPDADPGWGQAILVRGEVWRYASQTSPDGIQVVRLVHNGERGALTSLEAAAPINELVQLVDWLR